jgi:predicted amidophosphoribosyltransferase
MSEEKTCCPNCSKQFDHKPNFCDNCGYQFVKSFTNAKNCKSEKYFFGILGVFSLSIASATALGFFNSLLFQDILLRIVALIGIMIFLLFLAFLLTREGK